jgi:cystathionine beta-synthase
MQTNGFDQLPVTASTTSKHLVGIIGLGDALSKVASGRASLTDSVQRAMIKFGQRAKGKYTEVTTETLLESLDEFFNKFSLAVVTDKVEGEMQVRHVVTKVDLLSYLVKNPVKQ